MTTPKRGVGGATLDALGTYAGERHLSLFAAAFEEGFAQRVQPRQLAPLLEFCNFINRLEYRAAREAVARWRFVPARRGDIAIESWVLVPIVFKLQGN